MIITRTHLPRRAVLRGLGATIALPLLDGMVPALTPQRLTAAAPVRRFGAVYIGMGMNMLEWTQPAEGRLQINSILQPLEAFKDRLVVVSGLESREAEGKDGGVHARPQTTWLTGCRAKPTEGADVEAGTSLDQLIAQEFGKDTQLSSLELATEATDVTANSCAPGYSCAYSNTIAWRSPKSPLPMENNPRAVFERLFGISDSTDARVRAAEIQSDRSVLDTVTGKVTQLQQRLAPADRVRLTEYLDSVRDVERRLKRAEEQTGRELPVVDRPVGIPVAFEDHVTLMYDLQRLAFQTDLTRVFTFLVVREASVRAYPEIGVSDAYHPLSHHANNPEKLAKQAKVNTYMMKLFAGFLEKLSQVPEGDGTLLDHTLMLYGSGMSDSNKHNPQDLPTVIVGGQGFGLVGNRHLRFPNQPLANLQLTLLERLGMRMERFGDSTGELSPLRGV